jgi:hypothetical protein
LWFCEIEISVAGEVSMTTKQPSRKQKSTVKKSTVKKSTAKKSTAKQRSTRPLARSRSVQELADLV